MTMEMTEQEIVANYRNAAKKKAQIGILADLNLCTKEDIVDVLVRGGENAKVLAMMMSPKNGKRKEKKEEEPVEYREMEDAVIDSIMQGMAKPATPAPKPEASGNQAELEKLEKAVKHLESQVRDRNKELEARTATIESMKGELVSIRAELEERKQELSRLYTANDNIRHFVLQCIERGVFL